MRKIIIVLLIGLNSLNAQIDKSLVLNGCTDYLEIKENDLLDNQSILSIECWIQPNCKDGNRIIIGKQWCIGEYSYYLSVNEGKLLWSFSNNGYCSSLTNAYESYDEVIPVDIFTHVAIVHSESEIKMIINGTEVVGHYIKGSFGAIYNGNQEFRIGAYKDISSNFVAFYSGLIDELRVWNIELTEQLIKSRKDDILIGNEIGLILYLDMEEDEVGVNLKLKNKSLIGAQLDASSIGVTNKSPFCIPFQNYNSSPILLDDLSKYCVDEVEIGIDDHDYKSIIWSSGDTTSTITVSESGFYTVKVETELCKFYEKTIEVVIEEDFIIELDYTICSGEYYEYEGQFLEANTITEFLYTSVYGCDSLVILEVNGYEDQGVTNLSYTICSGEYYEYEGQFLEANTITEFMYTSVYGCDSMVVIEVYGYENQGETSLSYTICSGDYYEYEGQFLEANTITEFMYTSVYGCDSLVIIEVNGYGNQGVTNFLYTICSGEYYEYEGQYLEVNTITEFFYTSVEGCDSLVIVEVNGYENQGETNLMYTICSGEYYEYEGQFLEPNTSTEFLYTDVDGCDSVVVIDIIESVIISVPILEVSVCPNGVYEFEGQSLEVGSYTEYFYTDNNGCDSTIIIHVNEFEIEDIVLEYFFRICEETFSYQLDFENNEINNQPIGNTINLNENGIYFLKSINDDGCVMLDTFELEFVNMNTYVPNIILINDGINNCFRPFFGNNANIKYYIIIYDRWGNKVYDDSGYDICWNGYYKSQEVISGVYTYLIEFEDSCLNEKQMIGSLTVLR